MALCRYVRHHVFWYIAWDTLKTNMRLAVSRRLRAVRREALAAAAGTVSA